MWIPILLALLVVSVGLSLDLRAQRNLRQRQLNNMYALNGFANEQANRLAQTLASTDKAYAQQKAVSADLFQFLLLEISQVLDLKAENDDLVSERDSLLRELAMAEERIHVLEPKRPKKKAKK